MDSKNRGTIGYFFYTVKMFMFVSIFKGSSWPLFVQLPADDLVPQPGWK